MYLFFFSETGDINTLISTGRDTFLFFINFINCLSSILWFPHDNLYQQNIWRQHGEER